ATVVSSPSVFSTTPRPPTSPLFPYTTLFRSRSRARPPRQGHRRAGRGLRPRAGDRPCVAGARPADSRAAQGGRHDPAGPDARTRSEEHTSELQSLAYLVCRLLLEKKKKRQMK